jgi:hypothetical protein
VSVYKSKEDVLIQQCKQEHKGNHDDGCPSSRSKSAKKAKSPQKLMPAARNVYFQDSGSVGSRAQNHQSSDRREKWLR